MDPRSTPISETDRVAELRRELQRAYESLSEITSRLLLANEAVEAALSSQDRVELSERFLQVTTRGFEVRRAAVFLVERDGFSVGATVGLDADEVDALASSEDDIEACREALADGSMHVVDPALVADDAADLSAREPADEEDEDDEEEPEEGEEAEQEGTEETEEEAEEEEDEEDEGDPPDADGPTALFGLYLPVQAQDQPVAVLALGDRTRGVPFRGDELVFLRHLLSQFALALHRGTLLEQDAERLRERDALLKVSREITSTLNLDSVLRAVVNTVGAVVENDRAEIALRKGGRLVLRAVSGLPRLDPDQVELFKLQRPLEYLSLNPVRAHLSAEDLAEGGDRPGADVFSEYFSSQEMRSFMALPLKDEQGVLGFLCIESRQDSWSLHPAEGDALDILSAQTTVAIRNATLYSEIPLRGISIPIARARGRLGAVSSRTRTRLAAAAIPALIALLVPFFPERAGGPAEIRSLQVQGARAITEGVVAQVLVKGGESVRAGQLLAVLEDLPLAGRIAELKGEIAVLRRDIASARRAGDQGAWRSGQIQLAALEGSLALEQRRERGANLAAPFDGQVLELDLAQRVGQHLEAGETFCTIAALDRMGADIAVGEEKIGRVRVGEPVAVKVVAYPTRTFRGRVIEVGWRARPDELGRARFLVRAQIENSDRLLRPGMTGVGKAFVRRRSLAALGLEPVTRAFQLAWW